MDAVDVVIAGAGPAGLAVAATLGHYGVATLLVEPRPEPSDHPRATVISTRAMELLRAWRLEEAVRAGGVDADVVLWECETLAQAATGRRHTVGYPTREQAGMLSPTAPAVVAQAWLELALRRHIGSLRSVELRLGQTVVDLEDGPDAVVVTLRDAAGEARTVRARYLVAADGAHSSIRSRLGVRMSEPRGAVEGVQVVFRAPLWEVLGDVRCALYVVTTAAAPGSFLPAGTGERWVYAPHAPAPEVDPLRLAALIRAGSGVADLHPRIERIGRVHAPAQLAETFRVGRSFLAGDAAHRVTPRGGTGMNTALLSGYDLGWKLAWVLSGWAAPDLLDTYEAERRVVAEHNLARSTDPDGSRRPVLTELNVDLGGRLAHVWLPSASGAVSTIDLLGPGWTVFSGPARREWVAACSSLTPVTVRSLDAVTARAIGVRGEGALLVRPDGVPVAMWPSRGAAPRWSRGRRNATRRPRVPIGN
jgi:putative polyketide hydroxylase